MTCAHCCFSCGERGSFMSQEDFNAALELCKQNEQYITIGGGEPTLHPKFKEFLMQAIWELADVSYDMGSPAVTLVTNGSNTEVALTLAKLARTGVIAAALSQDEYHDPIDGHVVSAFTKEKRFNEFGGPARGDDHDCREIRRARSDNIMAIGRAKRWGTRKDFGCECDGIFINPKGIVYPCGCRKNPLGHIRSGNLPLVSEHFQDYCYKSKSYKDEVIPSMKERAERLGTV
jgi:MoaA/NifB/PqqE/SkfB family radical SAM enzyme